MNYYGQPQKSSKWIGVALGGLFATIALGCGFLIFHLTRATAVAAPPAAAVAAAPAQPAPAVQPAPAPAPPDEADATAQPGKSSRHHHHSSSSGSKVASAKGAPMSEAKAQEILAKHDTKEKKKQKDALDKLLGL